MYQSADMLLYVGQYYVYPLYVNTPAEEGTVSTCWDYLQLVFETGSGSLQMGGAEGVRKAEQYTLVVGLNRGMMMHAVPRDVA